MISLLCSIYYKHVTHQRVSYFVLKTSTTEACFHVAHCVKCLNTQTALKAGEFLHFLKL